MISDPIASAKLQHLQPGQVCCQGRDTFPTNNFIASHNHSNTCECVTKVNYEVLRKTEVGRRTLDRLANCELLYSTSVSELVCRTHVKFCELDAVEGQTAKHCFSSLVSSAYEQFAPKGSRIVTRRSSELEFRAGPHCSHIREHHALARIECRQRATTFCDRNHRCHKDSSTNERSSL